MNKGFTTEMHMRVYDDSLGCFVEIRDDQDGLNMAQVRWVEEDGKEHAYMNMPYEMLEKFIGAAKTYLDYRKANPLD